MPRLPAYVPLSYRGSGRRYSVFLRNIARRGSGKKKVIGAVHLSVIVRRARYPPIRSSRVQATVNGAVVSALAQCGTINERRSGMRSRVVHTRVAHAHVRHSYIGNRPARDRSAV